MGYSREASPDGLAFAQSLKTTKRAILGTNVGGSDQSHGHLEPLRTLMLHNDSQKNKERTQNHWNSVTGEGQGTN